jgi:hypothetical protein
MHNILAVQRVLRRYAVDRFLHTQAVLVCKRTVHLSHSRND